MPEKSGPDGIFEAKPFDVGKAESLPANDAAQGIYSKVRIDMDSLGDLYRKSGVPFVRRDIDEAALYWNQAARAAALPRSPLRARMAADGFKKASVIRREQARSTLRGAALVRRLSAIDAEERRELSRLGG